MYIYYLLFIIIYCLLLFIDLLFIDYIEQKRCQYNVRLHKKMSYWDYICAHVSFIPADKKRSYWGLQSCTRNLHTREE